MKLKWLAGVFVISCCSAVADPERTLIQEPLKTSSAYDSRFYVESNLEFTLLHELSHAVIELNNIPVLGGHERAADQIAIMLMLMTSHGFDEALFDKMLSISGEWMIEWRKEINQYPLIFWDAHPLAIQRFYDITCLMYGAASEKLEKIRNETWLPIERAWKCDKEYYKSREALLWLADNYSHVSFDSEWQLVPKPMIAPKQDIVRVEYIGPTQKNHQVIHDWLIKSKRINRIFERTNQILKLPKPVTIYFETQCAGPDAWWNPNINSIIICYSLIEQFEANSNALKPLVNQLDEEAEQAYLFLFPERFSGLISRDKQKLKKQLMKEMDKILEETH